IEYSCPNTNNPLHLGHIRNNILGHSLSEILQANGQKTIKVNLINDRGVHICKSMLLWQKWGNGETPKTSGMKGDKFVGKYYVEFEKHYKKEMNDLIGKGMSKEEAQKNAPLIKETQELLRKWEAKDPGTIDLWKKMNGWVYVGFDKTYEQMGVDFDKVYYESDTYVLGKEIVEKSVKDGILFKKEDGSIWCDLSKENLDDKLLLRSDGTSVYMTQDIGTAVQRFSDFKLDKHIYVVGNEQDYHFRVLFIILKKMGYEWADECQHLSYGMVDLTTGKMKSREGTVVDADDLMDEMIETAKKILPILWKSKFSLRIKLQSTFHLTNNLVFPFILLAAILNVPLIFIKNSGSHEVYFAFMSIFVIAFISTFLFYLYSQKDVYADWRKRIALFPLFMAGSMGLAINNSRAVFEGLMNRKSEFVRTPKFKNVDEKETITGKQYLNNKIGLSVVIETIMAAYCFIGVASSIYFLEIAALPFQLLFFTGFSFVAFSSIKHALTKNSV
ncbi:MAG: arginine--tRNA ligase, partial [Bacteroidetes bacterium]|nr:arginine--tRNA ligase [Bacteroidota bacterium]